MKNTSKGKRKDNLTSPSESKPKADKKDKQRNPVLWPETTEPPPTLKKPTKKASKREKS